MRKLIAVTIESAPYKVFYVARWEFKVLKKHPTVRKATRKEIKIAKENAQKERELFESSNLGKKIKLLETVLIPPKMGSK